MAQPQVIVVGEDFLDAQALAELVRALCPRLVVTPLRRPLRLRRGPTTGTPDVMVDKVLPVLRAALDAPGSEVRCIFVHADADAVAPADAALSHRIEAALAGLPVPVHAVVPAWELEAWWFLWPDACTAVVQAWRAPDGYVGRRVDLIPHAKEEFRRAVRASSRGSKSKRDYRVSDAPSIARAVRDSGKVRTPSAKSEAFERFRTDVDSCCPRGGSLA